MQRVIAARSFETTPAGSPWRVPFATATASSSADRADGKRRAECLLADELTLGANVVEHRRDDLRARALASVRSLAPSPIAPATRSPLLANWLTGW